MRLSLEQRGAEEKAIAWAEHRMWRIPGAKKSRENRILRARTRLLTVWLRLHHVVVLQ
jgi:hypothetical protein